MPHLYLVDGSGYIFRAYHRLPPLTNKRGEPSGAVYGYTTMLWKLLDEVHSAEGPTHMAVIFDKASHTFRNDLYPEYKAHRPSPPEDLTPQFPVIRDATRAFSLPCIEEAMLEADDIIASYAKAALGQGWQVTIVSSDKDLMQLIEPGLDLYDTMNNRRLGADYVVEKFGVGPDKLGDVLALMGDSVDNVPGVPGVGPKTASKLIAEHGDVEGVLAAAEGMKKGKLRDNLIEHAEAARMSRVLVTLKDDAALAEPLDALALPQGGIPDAPLRAFIEDQGFKSLLPKLALVAAAPVAEPAADREMGENEPACDPAAYETVADLETLDRWIAEATAQGHVAVDTETDSLDATRARLVGVSLALAPNRACYVPVAHEGGDLVTDAPVQLSADDVVTRLKPMLEDASVLKIGHNLKYDMIVLGRLGIEVAPYDDTIILSYDLDAGLHGHKMDELAATHLSHSCIAFKDVIGTGKTKRAGFHQVPLDEATRYAAEDADVTLRLWKRFKARLPVEGATRVYEMVDRPLVPVIARMERRGIRVDVERLAQLSREFEGQIAGYEAEVHRLAGTEFAIGSPKQLGDILFEQMGMKGGRKGKSGVYSTDVTELERLAREEGPGAELVRRVLDWRQLTKLKNTYTDALQAQVNPETGRVHTSYSLTGAQTGRLSSTEPNLQNIPIRTETGRQLRDAFVAESGHVLLAADYSQIELRLAAHMADVPQLKEAFANGDDIHSLTAAELFGEVTRDARSRAKTINFAILYGISRWGLAQRLDVSADEAQAMIDRYFDRFPGINRYIAETLTHARDHGYTTTLFGRKCWFPRIKSRQQNERGGAERAAVNAPVQGTSADIIKRAMVRMEPALAEAGLDCVRMLLQVHDELVFEVPEGRADAAAEVIRHTMEGAAEPAVTLSVPLGVEVGTGASWGAAH